MSTAESSDQKTGFDNSQIDHLAEALWDAVDGIDGIELAVSWRRAGLRNKSSESLASETQLAQETIVEHGGGLRGFKAWVRHGWPELERVTRSNRGADAQLQLAEAKVDPAQLGVRQLCVADLLSQQEGRRYGERLPTDIKGSDGTHGFIIDGLLSPEECSALIQASTNAGYEELESVFPRSYRTSDRVMTFDSAAASMLYERLMQHMIRTDFEGLSPLCFGQAGIWKPCRVNECLKFSRYQQGGKFWAHRDGPWLPQEDQASLLTLVCYLNHDFEGGDTIFDDPNVASERDYYGWGQQEGTTVHPRTGRAVLFAHQAWHGSAKVVAGTKYILRSEVIFQRVDMLLPARYSFLDDPNYIKARRLYELSRALDHGVSPEGFVEVYAKVLSLQCAAAASVVESHQTRSRSMLLVAKLGLSAAHMVLSRVPPVQLRLFRGTAYSWCWQLCDAELWRAIYYQHYPEEHDRGTTVAEPFVQDWFGNFWRRAMIEERFQPVVVMLDPCSVAGAIPTGTAEHRVFESVCTPFVQEESAHLAYHMAVPDYLLANPVAFADRADPRLSKPVVNPDGSLSPHFGYVWVIADAIAQEICRDNASEQKLVDEDDSWARRLYGLHPLLLIEPLQGWSPQERSLAVATLSSTLRTAGVAFVNMGEALVESQGVGFGVALWFRPTAHYDHRAADDESFEIQIAAVNEQHVSECRRVHFGEDAAEQVMQAVEDVINAHPAHQHDQLRSTVLLYISLTMLAGEEAAGAAFMPTGFTDFWENLIELIPDLISVPQSTLLEGACAIGAASSFRERCIFKLL